VLEDIDDGFADLGRRKGGSVYEPTPTIDFIFGADDHFIGVAIHPDKALSFLNPSHQIVDAHGLGLHLAASAIKPCAVYTEGTGKVSVPAAASRRPIIAQALAAADA
jgi:hypothetical protein